MNSHTTINSRISEYAGSSPARFHMPGNKGKIEVYGSMDVTELPFTFDMYSDGEMNERVFRQTAGLFGADMTLYSCSGATLAIQSAVFTCARSAKLALSAVHISVSYAMALCRTEPLYFTFGDDILPLIERGAEAVFVTSEDYYGRISPEMLKRYAAACHKAGIPLICDNSHGTHLAFWNGGSLHPLKCSADVVIDSAHKTLPALTGGAFLHLNGSASEKWREYLASMRVFGSTSPSYLIACSLENSASYMAKNPQKLAALKNRIDMVRNAASEKCAFLPEDGSDPFRLTLFSDDPARLDAHLAGNGVISEFHDAFAVVLIPSVMNTPEDFERLTAALLSSDSKPGQIPPPICEHHSADMLPADALLAKVSPDGIASRPIYDYPPGTAVVHIGEKQGQKDIEF